MGAVLTLQFLKCLPRRFARPGTMVTAMRFFREYDWFHRTLSSGLIAVLLCWSTPGSLRGQHNAPPLKGACGTGTVSCCCGVAGGCGRCPTEQRTASQRETAQLAFHLAGCPGPAREASAPSGGPECILPDTKISDATPQVAMSLFLGNNLEPESPSLTPELPPPRHATPRVA